MLKQTFKTCKLKEIASFEMGQSPDSSFVNEDGKGLPFLQGCAEFGSQTPNYNFYCSQPKKNAEAGDILISVRAPVGTLNKADRNYCIGRGLAAVRFNKDTLPQLGWHLLNYWSRELQRVAQGSTFEAVGKSELENLKVLEIPKYEQQKIAEILDTVDKTIALTQTHISKLKLAKAGLLHDLLTKGIDEHGELRNPTRNPQQFKDSSLGRIPKDWDVVNLESLCERITDGSHQSVTTSDTGIPFLYVSCVRDGQILWEQAAKISDLLYTQISKGREPKAGLILYTAVGSYGHAALVRDNRKFSFQRHIAYVLPNPEKIF
ncbi:MAG: hypothetical protein HC917_24315, partial [Richelia sp. SM2_1_7]|nr:hypothetical protein [Richelia sp. SM2_1_7]